VMALPDSRGLAGPSISYACEFNCLSDSKPLLHLLLH